MTIPRIVTQESLQSRVAETRSTCPYCGVGCGVMIRTEGTQIVDVRGDPEPPANSVGCAPRAARCTSPPRVAA